MNNIYKTSFQIGAKKKNYSKLDFSKTDSSFKVKSALNSTDKDIYYDEVIYYDGGDVYGHGNDE